MFVYKFHVILCFTDVPERLLSHIQTLITSISACSCHFFFSYFFQPVSDLDKLSKIIQWMEFIHFMLMCQNNCIYKIKEIICSQLCHQDYMSRGELHTGGFNTPRKGRFTHFYYLLMSAKEQINTLFRINNDHFAFSHLQDQIYTHSDPAICE